MYAVFSSIPQWQYFNIYLDVGLSVPAKESVHQSLTMFTIEIIYGDTKSETLAECRASKWNSMKKKATQRLPPDEDSHRLRSKRVNYQTYLYLTFDVPDPPPSPLNHGWHLKDGKCMPVQYTKPALPSDFNYLSSTCNNCQDEDSDSSDDSEESECSSVNDEDISDIDDIYYDTF